MRHTVHSHHLAKSGEAPATPSAALELIGVFLVAYATLASTMAEEELNMGTSVFVWRKSYLRHNIENILFHVPDFPHIVQACYKDKRITQGNTSKE